MKRKTVTIHVVPTGFCEGKPEEVEARCDKCVYWMMQGSIPSNGVDNIDGECFRYPKRVRKIASSWCGEFKPEVDE